MGCKCPYKLRESLVEAGVPEDEALVESWIAYFMSDEEWEKYPFDKCLTDMTRRYGSKERAQRVCGKIKASRKRSESPLQKCVSNKVSVIKHHDPDTPQKEALGHAYGYCRKKLGKDG